MGFFLIKFLGSFAMPEIAPTTIEDGLAARLGQIVISWAAVEEWLSHLLAVFIDADPAGLTILTGTAGAATQIKWIQTVITVFEHQTDFTEIKELLIWADDLRVDRNALAHGTWDPTGCEPGTCSVTTYNWQKTEVMKTWLITSSDLDELLSGIHEWIREYVRLGRKYAFPRVKGKPGSIFDHDD
ncbi:hypothetical protein [Bradyrhizobium diazoefficiens]